MPRKKRRHNARGMELSINFIVTLILSIVIFGFGIYLVKQFFGFANEAQAKVDIDTKAVIEQRLLDAGDKAAIPLSKAKARVGESYTFGLGVLNTFNSPHTFSVSMKFTKAFDESGDEVTQAEPTYINKNWLFSSIPDISLGANEHAIIPLTVRVDSKMTEDGHPTQKGYTYVFNVCVQRDGVALVKDCANVDRSELSNLHGDQVLKVYVQVV